MRGSPDRCRELGLLRIMASGGCGQWAWCGVRYAIGESYCKVGAPNGVQ